MGVDIFMKPVFEKSSSQRNYAPKNGDDVKRFLARSHRINEVVRYGKHSKFLPSNLKFTWLDHLVDLNEMSEKIWMTYPVDWELAVVTEEYVFDPVQILLDLETVCEIMQRENDNLPMWYWFIMEHRGARDEELESLYLRQGINSNSGGISKTRGVSAIVEGTNWKFDGDWDYCQGYPADEGENSPNKINYVSFQLLPTIECYAISYGIDHSLKRYQNKDRPDILTMERISYFDSQKTELGYMMDVCKYAIQHSAKICFYVSY
jgi:hypothetical protein